MSLFRHTVCVEFDTLSRQDLFGSLNTLHIPFGAQSRTFLVIQVTGPI